ncbi:MAG: hypothetical protein AB1469_06390 [Pseudomonadota bacterium]
MPDQPAKPSILQGSKATEMLMRDVLDGLEDFTTLVGLHSDPCAFEILLTPPRQESIPPPPPAPKPVRLYVVGGKDAAS